jgi:hypothetical protein
LYIYCGQLGLTFGRNEVLMYAYSIFNGNGVVTLLDVNGNEKWYLTIADSIRTTNQLLEYKAINSAADMIIAISGNDYINYNRIISQSAPPYTVQTSS